MRLGAPYAPLRLRLQRAGQPPEKELIRMRLKMATQIGEGIPSVKIRVRRFGWDAPGEKIQMRRFKCENPSEKWSKQVALNEQIQKNSSEQSKSINFEFPKSGHSIY